jgi:hypothetical protein
MVEFMNAIFLPKSTLCVKRNMPGCGKLRWFFLSQCMTAASWQHGHIAKMPIAVHWLQQFLCECNVMSISSCNIKVIKLSGKNWTG